MKPTDFLEANFTYNRPPSMTEEECGDLRVFKDAEHIISCWELSQEEILNLLLFKVVWLRVYGGAQPPVLLEATSPFINSENKVVLSDTARANLFKLRLAEMFMTETGIKEDFDVPDTVDNKESLQKFLMDFIDFLTKRGV